MDLWRNCVRQLELFAILESLDITGYAGFIVLQSVFWWNRNQSRDARGEILDVDTFCKTPNILFHFSAHARLLCVPDTADLHPPDDFSFNKIALYLGQQT